MNKADYGKAPYKPSEWRHGIMFVNAVNFRAENMTVVESGGDGVDILGARCRNGVIRRVTCDRCNRQGLSVEGCTGLLIEDCVFMNTQGRPPESGVDFEPFRVDQPMVDIVMRNCRIENNGGCGIESWTGASDGTSKPYSITVENCQLIGNRNGIRIGGGFWFDPKLAPQGLARGRFTFRNCLIEKSHDYAITMDAMPESMRVEFVGCTARETGGGDERTDVRLKGLARDGGFAGGTVPSNILFENFTVVQEKPRAWAKCEVLADLTPGFLKDVKGTVEVIGPKDRKTVDLGR